MPRARGGNKSSSKTPGGTLRIIGGSWRGRKLSFREADGLRPTGDRVRETLFNWIAAEVPGARCLDLFSGSGALGLEALSRGAAHVDFVDNAREAVSQVREHLALLDASDRGHCHLAEAESFLANASGAYDIVFLDPPFGRGLAGPVCSALAESGLLAQGAQIYLEMARNEEEPELPAAWDLYRDKQAGAVRYRLYLG